MRLETLFAIKYCFHLLFHEAVTVAVKIKCSIEFTMYVECQFFQVRVVFSNQASFAAYKVQFNYVRHMLHGLQGICGVIILRRHKQLAYTCLLIIYARKFLPAQ